ncbi:nitrite reductase small subunit NirD [Vibrio sinaloensis]|uniref:nitrite reductase small subunit NirD n=1 Tax=Vibrio TaxID=662 RepID=UPI0022AE6BF2|nr:nitrite reductase small subunit NirD [Vibrio sinaloensis]MCZ4293203.1 nitrite reductase small subunit NirD [Vibrio sinaloensis]
MEVVEAIKVCDLSQLTPYQGRTALIDGQQVALFYVPDSGLFALQNWDPIGKAYVLSRGIVGDVKGKLCVASPLYKQHFCLSTGECIEDPSVSVKCWPVRESHGDVLLG